MPNVSTLPGRTSVSAEMDILETVSLARVRHTNHIVTRLTV